VLCISDWVVFSRVTHFVIEVVAYYSFEGFAQYFEEGDWTVGVGACWVFIWFEDNRYFSFLKGLREDLESEASISKFGYEGGL